LKEEFGGSFLASLYLIHFENKSGKNRKNNSSKASHQERLVVSNRMDSRFAINGTVNDFTHKWLFFLNKIWLFSMLRKNSKHAAQNIKTK